MAFEADTLGPARFHASPVTGFQPHVSAFDAAISRAIANDIRSETPDNVGSQAGGRPVGQVPPGREPTGAGPAEPTTEGAGNLPPGNRRPRVAAAPDPDEFLDIYRLLQTINTTVLSSKPVWQLNDYASALRDVARGRAPASLKQECRAALDAVVEAGGTSRPPMTAIAKAVAAPKLGVKAAYELAALLLWLPSVQMREFPAGQLDTLFGKYHALRNYSRLAEPGTEKELRQIHSVCNRLVRDGIPLILSQPLSRHEVRDVLNAPDRSIAGALAAMTDQQLVERSISRALCNKILNGRPERRDEAYSAAIGKVRTSLAMSAIPSQLQVKVDQALADFPHLNKTIRIAVMSRPKSISRPELPPLFYAGDSAAVAADMNAELAKRQQYGKVDISISQIALMYDYFIDQSASIGKPFIRHPGQAEFRQQPIEAALVVPPGTEVRIGDPFNEGFASFTLPPLS